MASSLQTLVKILNLERQKGYQNKAVIGGLARFSYHWAREAHSQAQIDAHHLIVDEIAGKLRNYETASEEERPALLEEIIALATGQEAEEAAAQPVITKQAPQETPEAQAAIEDEEPDEEPDEEADVDEEDEESEFIDPSADEDTLLTTAATVRERRGYTWQHQADLGEVNLDGLNATVTTISGVGAKRQEQLARLSVETVGDLLFLFPRRHDDYSQLKAIHQLKMGDEVTVIGSLERIQVQTMRSGGKRVEAYLGDGSGFLHLNWFNQPWIANQLEEKATVAARGKIDQYLGRLVMNSPELEPMEEEYLLQGRIVPIYPLTEGLGAKVMRNLAKEVVDTWAKHLPDYLPIATREHADLMDFGDAVSQAHFPDSWQDKLDAEHRLAFDELFTLQMTMLQRRHLWQSRQGMPLSVEQSWLEAFEQSLPYQLTGAQQHALADICTDMASDIPMNRLLQGDVGSGKTVVAAVAVGMAVANGAQAAIMAPTGILAEQHYNGITKLLHNSPLGENVNVALLTGNLSQGERDAIYQELATGDIQVVIGTHALIQPGVQFAKLGLAVIDEQHRFGVAQRGSLREKGIDGGNPHLLVMTATPIPRTLSLTLYGDLDLSIIDEMPPGREPVETRILQAKERERAYAFIRGQVEKGHQAYIIYPLVEESEKLDAGSATEGYERLQSTIFPDLRLGLLHGRMHPDEKDAVMAGFYRGELDILVSTTVIEVGIDVPNATIIMIEDANRFGLAQLHQLRGRVGRGGNTSYCLLISDKSFLDGDVRLQAMEETTDGFRLAQIDWELRGAGELLGTRQSGFREIRFADMMDARLVEQIQHEARTIFENDPALSLPEHQMLKERVSQTNQEGDIS